MIGWSVELSELDIRYELRGAIKSQCLTDFSAELTPLPTFSGGWTLYVDGSSNKTTYGVRVVLEGRPGNHPGTRTMAAKVLRAVYYWPTVQGDCVAYVKKCAKCQEFDPLHHTRPKELHSIISPWPFPIWRMNIIEPFAPGKGQTKFLLVGVDYFTKWIEAKPLASCSGKNVQNFVWRSIVCRFGVPHTIIIDNDRQFIDQGLQSFYDDLGIKSVTVSVEHPQTNGQAETANKVILNELKKRLSKAKGRWTEELIEVLWAYRCTPQTTTQETPYNLTYGAEAMIPVEVVEPTIRKQMFDLTLNEESLPVNLNLVSEFRDKSKIREAACKIRASRRYNTNVWPRSFQKSDLVWRMRSDARKNEGEFSSNWEGPFRVREVAKGGAYHLEWILEKIVPRTCNVTHLKFYYN